MQIKDNAFIVTGAASGLGAATARMISENGGKVVLADVQNGQALATELRGRFVHCDVSSEKDAEAAVTAALALGPLRGLVNCAGMAPAARTVGKAGPHPLDLFEKTVRVNLIGSFNMSRIAAAAMARLPAGDELERGVIVHTASIAAYDAQAGQAAYAASKAGVVGMTLAMARDLAVHGIRVMSVAPGVFETPMLRGMPAEVQNALAQSAPFPARLGRPREFAELVKAIVENCMLNGETIRLDGGLRMPPR
jgi:NAD(P)-dependent dehydrogenase (short-subunit alcohol dehydrogenase family)